jgi:hypothetical protein
LFARNASTSDGNASSMGSFSENPGGIIAKQCHRLWRSDKRYFSGRPTLEYLKPCRAMSSAS